MSDEPNAQQPEITKHREWIVDALVAVVLMALCCGLYLQWIDNDFIYDDQLLILKISAPRSFPELMGVFEQQLTERDPNWPDLPYYRPVARFTYVWQKYLHGDRPAPYHVFNAVLVALTAIVGYQLLRLPTFGINRWAAIAMAALFAVHPITSVVAYPISARETILPTFFTVVAVYFFMRGGRWIIAAYVSFVLGLMTKELAVVIPCIFFMADFLQLTPNPPKLEWKRWLIRYVPIVLIFAGYFAIRSHLFAGTSQHQFVLFERPLGPAMTMLFTWQTTLLPFWDLIYEPAAEIWWSTPRVISSSVLVALAVYWFWRQPWHPRRVGLFWLSWAVLGLLPISNILHQEAKFAERYGFLPLIGWLGIIGCLMTPSMLTSRRRWQVLTITAVAGIALTVVSHHRGVFFSSDSKFLDQWVTTSPDSVQANVSLAQFLIESNQPKIAITYCQKALSIDDEISRGHSILGAALGMTGKFQDAESACRRAIELQPNLAEAYNNLGFIFAVQDRLPEAAEQYEMAARVRPRFFEAYFNLGNVYDDMDELDESVRYFTIALSLNPDYAEAHNNLGLVYEKQGKYEQAMQRFATSLRLRPGMSNALENFQRVRQRLR